MTSEAIREGENFNFKILFPFTGQVLSKTKEHYQTEKKFKIVLNLILDALFGSVQLKMF